MPKDFINTIILFVLALGFGGLSVSEAKVFRTLPEALEQERQKEPGAQWKTETLYLSEAEMRAIEKESGLKMDSALLVREVLVSSHRNPSLTAYTDTHKVRTHPETVLVLVQDQEIKRVEVLSFDEPLEYLPKTRWFDVFKNTKLGPDLQLKRQIPFVTGASLSAKAIVDATRRILACDRILLKRKGKI